MAKKVLSGNDNTNGFQENPQNINRNGRPRKSFSVVNDELKAKGVEPLTKSNLIDAYSLIFNSTEDDLKEIAQDKNTPYALKLIINELNDKRTRSKAIADYRDYMFGKAMQSTDITSKGKEITSVTRTIIDESTNQDS